MADMAGETFAFGPFVLDMQRATLVRQAKIFVGHKGLALLHALLQVPTQPLSKSELMQAAWPGIVVEESNLSVQIAALRKHIGPQADGREWIITVPRVGYKFIGDVQRLDQSAASKRVAGVDPRAATDRPSIAVLPLANVSGDKEQDYFVDGLTEDIITALTRFRWFRVIGRNSSFVLQGQVGRFQTGRRRAWRPVCNGGKPAGPGNTSAFQYNWSTLPQPARSGPSAMPLSWRRFLRFRMRSRNGWREPSNRSCSRPNRC
jgi:DNA-binding winged helix-turn-helix (wHTH) protein